MFEFGRWWPIISSGRDVCITDVVGELDIVVGAISGDLIVVVGSLLRLSRLALCLIVVPPVLI